MPATFQQLGPRVRGVCSVCWQERPIKNDGRIRKHGWPSGWPRTTDNCSGSGKPPREEK